MVRWGLAVALACFASAATSDIVGRAAVVDGDTFRVNGTAIRLHGIDAPEQKQPCTRHDGTVWACGAWVSDQVRRSYAGKRVRCEALTTDRYGRTIARCFYRTEDIGQRLVRDGLAFAFRRYSDAYDLEEIRAVAAQRGVHASVVQRPATFRRAGSVAPAPPNPACQIKGNISSGGSIFHVPGQAAYDRTRISVSRGERWFCSEADAIAAGWRKAYR